MAGDIYVHDRGGVPLDIEAGLGWLGVAARPQTAPRIQTYFRRALTEMSPQQKKHVEEAVRRYREEWSSRTGGCRAGERSRHRRRAWAS